MADTQIVKHPVQEYLKNPAVVSRTEELLKNRAGQFLTSLMAAINNVANLEHCVPQTVYAAAITAASLDLPINNNLGFAYLIPYKNNKTNQYEAQFQMGYKGFIQLAQRTGLYKQISATEVYEGQLVSEDPLNGNTYDWKKKTSEDIIGYVAKFRLINGFEHELYMPIEKMRAHGKRYSQSFKKNYGPWQDDFDVMAIKTVLKLLISKFGPLSVELQKAIERDQAIIKDENKGEIEYVDASKEETPAVEVKSTKLFVSPEVVEPKGDHIPKSAEPEPETPKAQVKVTKKAQNDQDVISGKITAILASFEKIGIMPETLERYMRKPSAEWNDVNLADLKALGSGLKKAGEAGVREWLEKFEKTESEVKELFGEEPKKDELTFGND